MPELPEVETTVKGLNDHIKGLAIKDVWTDYYSEFHIGKSNIKDREYFKKFKELSINNKVIGSRRIGKNVIIDLSGGKSIVVHMKMTGHLLYGKYKKTGSAWTPAENSFLKDPFNRFIHVIFTLSNGKHLAFSDMRKFARITIENTKGLLQSADLKHIGPDPLSRDFNLKEFTSRLKNRRSGKIKQVLMDQSIIAGVGNIYSDESLWLAGIHPTSLSINIPDNKLKNLFSCLIKVLKKGIDFGGDSMSDYRNVNGERGRFQNKHNVYRLRGTKCKLKNCKGVIQSAKMNGRTAHFCDTHQIKYS
ncbi:MAG: DNA-formamidopyrimidine glycosylase [Candidatus Taylorbacteria bacterium RIFCSPLOWO2_12_FULL_43_20]|uniref:DNA-formamidopyrimidine glycosylase n=1 Tax=Candidatus Taylorbacteria bacterium RIFCSPLOWO2_12_FULL_43_20 TaxID=1802332 RepID=A0A1G2P2R2_9BACT|nr:MAG: DNA-formamidopyrimidine glycosylase [Candidatus Taylorbacteria bacterium RIFCSPHIGHO2_02_FULL_43_55]OHA29927.1 MAG: DNA-formamidopyrimidine glycosylase [Candidatus Taylorbacteria bacterium RIFCSPHIGHO2_12_FULL_42_34]OHA30559.1 MAG: DNA-formamidopyrimidine glycosylase [Candidatus Taylorbacteria bacterium RIFCSPLOWO2_01_FULL_43_83]OHA38391.1 MAG: DNA-formamidopyrimidine glycosylase [Candidatus Taylorbacteria bacterium RIFCSPLOWO2_02_FULL_43_22b]OHA41999.1 MAG: DNA-formamidopyrimidine glyc